MLVITGFGSYQICKNGMDSIRRFLVLRYFKLLILCVLSTLIVLILANFHLTYYQGIIGVLNTPWFDGFNPLDGLYSYRLLNDPLSSLSAYNNPLWTMKISFVGSIVTVMLSIILNKEDRARWLVYIIAALICINLGDLMYIACIAGVVLGDLYDHFPTGKLKIMYGVLLFGIGIWLCGCPTGIESNSWGYGCLPFKYIIYYHIAGSACIVYSVLFTPNIAKVFSCRFLQNIGRISSSVYIVHYCVLISFSAYLFLKLNVRFTYNLNCLITILCTVAVVFFSAYFLEKIIRMLYRLINNIYDRLCSHAE